MRATAAILLFSGLCGCASHSSSSIVKSDLSAGALSSSNHVEPRLKPDDVRPPLGFVAFCQRFSDQCAARDVLPLQVLLTEDTLQEIEAVNVAINRAIRPEEDRAHYGVEEYWTIPIDGFGDCDDYVVVKRKALLNLGFPESTLRIAEVFAPGFVRHVVLIVRTDKGNYVLDNLKDEVATWDHVPYGWIKWQDAASTSGWASLH